MAVYIANNASRDTVTIMLSKAEAKALLSAAENAETYGINRMTVDALNRSMRALDASINTSARRAGFFD